MSKRYFKGLRECPTCKSETTKVWTVPHENWTGKCKAFVCENCEDPENPNRWRATVEGMGNLGMYLATDSDTGGGVYYGYNHGLDAFVENRGHYNQLVKEKGLRNVG